MNLEEQIAIMQHHLKGGKIEVLNCTSKVWIWRDIENPNWNWRDNSYRIQQESANEQNSFINNGFVTSSFRGEILADMGDEYVLGYYIETHPCIVGDYKVPTMWNKLTGICYKGGGISNTSKKLELLKSVKSETPKETVTMERWLMQHAPNEFYIVEATREFIKNYYKSEKRVKLLKTYEETI